MQVEDARKIIAVMMVAYPNFKPVDVNFMAQEWANMLSEYTYQQVDVALRCYITTDTSGFAPSIGKIVEKIKSVSEPQQLNELEAWSLVSKALSNGYYGANEEYEKLPPLVRKAVGDPANIREWSQLDFKALSVIQSNFERVYRAVTKREDEVSRMPSQIRQLIQENEPKMKIENNSTKVLEDKQKNYKPMSDEVKARFEELKR